MSAEPEGPVVISWSQQAAGGIRNFLELLATDEQFYDRVADDPQAVLADYGITIPDELIPSARRLPPREQITALINSLSDPQGPQDPFWTCLCPGLALAAGASPAAGAEE